jgi:hypothetical protein
MEQTLACFITVSKDRWLKRTPNDENLWDAQADQTMRRLGAILTPVTREAIEDEAEIDGMRLFGEFEGEPMPPIVLLRYTAIGIPKDGS